MTKYRTFQLDVIEKIHIPDSCYVQLPDARLYSIAQIESDTKKEDYHWAVKFKNLFPSLNPSVINDLVKSFQKSTNTLAPVDPFLYHALHHNLKRAFASIALKILVIHFSILLSIVVLYKRNLLQNFPLWLYALILTYLLALLYFFNLHNHPLP